MEKPKTQEETSISHSSVQKQIEIQKEFISDRESDLEDLLIDEARLKNKINEIKSDLSFSRQILAALLEQLNPTVAQLQKSEPSQITHATQAPKKRRNIDKEILEMLSNQDFSIPEVHGALLLNYNISISLVGLRTKILKFEKAGKVIKVNPESKRNMKYRTTEEGKKLIKN